MLQVGSDDDGYSVRMKFKHFLRYLTDPVHAPADDSPLYIFDGVPLVLPNSHRPSYCMWSCTLHHGWFIPAEAGLCSTEHAADPEHLLPDILLTVLDFGTVAGTFADREGSSAMHGDYEVPALFQEDLFQHVGERRRPPYRCGPGGSEAHAALSCTSHFTRLHFQACRPKTCSVSLYQQTSSVCPATTGNERRLLLSCRCRWFVMGPARSGSGLHVDPLATSAWNALLAGTKRWALFPPGTPRCTAVGPF